MKANRFLFGIVALTGAVALWGCSADETGGQQVSKIPATISLTSELNNTRTTADPQTTKLNTAVKVGVFGVCGSEVVTNGSNSSYDVTSGGDLNTAKAMTWPDEDEGSISIYAYAPYQSGWQYNAANSFTIAGDQSTDEGYLASDLLWGVPAKNPVAPSDKAVPLTFSHMMAKINIAITIGVGAPDVSKARITINNTLPTTSLNPQTGALGAAAGSIADITVVSALGSDRMAYGIIVPQTLVANTKLITIDTNPGASDNKNYIARLNSATTFVAGKQYNFSLTLGVDPELIIEPAAATINNWTDNDTGSLEAEEKVTYQIGDYILTDGTFVKSKQLTSTDQPKVAGIIFSTDVSAKDAAAGYDAYVMGISRQKMAFHKSDAYPSQMVTDNMVNELSEAIADLDGLTRTTAMLKSGYYASLGSNKTASMLNLSWYSSGKAKTITSKASMWYLPSFGQLVQILNNLGGADFTAYDFGEDGFGSSGNYTVGDADALETLAANLQAYVTKAGGDSNMFTVGNINYPSCTENGSTSGAHYGKVFSVNFTNSDGWSFGKALGRTDSQNYSVIPVAAVMFEEPEAVVAVTSAMGDQASEPARSR